MIKIHLKLLSVKTETDEGDILMLVVVVWCDDPNCNTGQKGPTQGKSEKRECK